VPPRPDRAPNRWPASAERPDEAAQLSGMPFGH
jgi:biotin synthase